MRYEANKDTFFYSGLISCKNYLKVIIQCLEQEILIEKVEFYSTKKLE